MPYTYALVLDFAIVSSQYKSVVIIFCSTVIYIWSREYYISHLMILDSGIVSDKNIQHHGHFTTLLGSSQLFTLRHEILLV